jgi:hypothetical protein
MSTWQFVLSGASRKLGSMAKTKLEFSEATRALAARLKERDPIVVLLLDQLLAALGPETVATLCAEAERLEAAGGEHLAEQGRQRTLGGFFFRLARARVPGLWKRQARFAREITVGRRPPPARPTPPTAPPPPPASEARPAGRGAAKAAPVVVVRRPRMRP